MTMHRQSIIVHPDGFELVGNDRVKGSYKWSDVTEVTAYKLDLLTTDEARLQLSFEHSPHAVVVSEEADGFDSFKPAIQFRFQFSDGWWSRLVQTAFATGKSVLYRRRS